LVFFALGTQHLREPIPVFRRSYPPRKLGRE